MIPTWKHAEKLLAVGSALLLFAITGCSKNNSPIQSQPTQSTDYQFNDVVPYSELSVSEVNEFVALQPLQVDRVRGPLLELSAALIQDHRSDDMPPGFGVERYASFIIRINGVLSPTQQEAFGRVVAFHVDLIGFGKDLRQLLRRLARALDLTPAQVEQLKGFARAYADSAREVFRKVRAGELTRDEAKTQIQQLHENFIESFKNILTPEQLEKLNEILSHRRDH